MEILEACLCRLVSKMVHFTSSAKVFEPCGRDGMLPGEFQAALNLYCLQNAF